MKNPAADLKPVAHNAATPGASLKVSGGSMMKMNLLSMVSTVSMALSKPIATELTAGNDRKLIP
jgi:hypothetical protein